MRKITTLLTLLLLCVVGAQAQVTASLVTGYGDPLTLAQFKALAGTSGRFAFVASSNTASSTAPRCDHWCGFTSTHNTTTLSEDYLFFLEASGDNYKVKRSSDGLYVNTSTSSTSFGTGGSEFKLVNRDPNDATKAVTGEQSISFEDPTNASNHYNANAVKYNTGLGAWTTYAVFGPFYIVTVNLRDIDESIIRTESYFVTDGTTVTAPDAFDNYYANGEYSVTVDGNDAVLNAYYVDATAPKNINIGYQTGVYYRWNNNKDNQENNAGSPFSSTSITGSQTSAWSYKWVSQETHPVLTLQVSGKTNNFDSSTNNFAVGQSGSSTWVFSVPEGYIITGWKVVGKTKSGTITLTTPSGKNVTFTTSAESTVEETGLISSSATFVLSGGNNQIIPTEFYATVKYVGEVKVTYVVSDAEGEVIRDEAQVLVGTTINGVPSNLQRAFCNYNGTPISVVADGSSVYSATVTYNLPFTVSNSFDEATWYNMTIRSNSHVFMGSTEPYYPASSASYAEKEQPEYRWAFMGNPYTGITVLNKAAGAGYTLTKDSINVVMREGTYSWTILERSNGFILKETGSATNYVNQNGGASGYLGFWNNTNGATDDGSTFRVTAAIDNYYELVEAEVIPFLMDSEMNPSSTIGKPFGLSQTAATSIVQTYMTQLNNQVFTLSEYEAITAAKNDGILYPTDGFYRIKNVSNNKYLRATKFAGMYDTGAITVDKSIDDASYDVATVIQVVTDANGHQRLISNNAYLGWVFYDSYGPVVTTNSNDKYVNWVLSGPGVTAINIPYAQATSGGYYDSAFYGLNGETVIGTTISNATTRWTLEPATSVSVKLNNIEGDHAYATFYAPFDVEFSGATAYTVTRGGDAVDGVGSQAVITAVEGTVPAGTPVVLIADEGTASCIATIKGTDAEALSAENILSGHYFAGTVAENSLVFGKANGVAGFYKYADYATVLGANRAFIAPEEAASVRALVFVDPTTGISSSLFNTEDGTAYDLQGRRVNNTSKGLYILNGKKVLVK
ncbi:MAG: hypothetical protein IJ659_03115 [Alloprevotella sp.]|nr:hypothetical protein [Alloprevotella sp.]